MLALMLVLLGLWTAASSLPALSLGRNHGSRPVWLARFPIAAESMEQWLASQSFPIRGQPLNG